VQEGHITLYTLLRYSLYSYCGDYLVFITFRHIKTVCATWAKMRAHIYSKERGTIYGTVWV